MVATTIETIRDLGVPTLVGVIVGALIAHFAAKARAREEFIVQDERRAAQSGLEAAREIRNRINVGAAEPYGQLHNEWSDRVLAPARLIRRTNWTPGSARALT